MRNPTLVTTHQAKRGTFTAAIAGFPGRDWPWLALGLFLRKVYWPFRSTAIEFDGIRRMLRAGCDVVLDKGLLRAEFGNPQRKAHCWLRPKTSDVRVFEDLILRDQYGAALKWLKKVGADQNPYIIDGGANIGLFAAYCALKLPACFIQSVEPDAGNFDLLQRNVGALKQSCAGETEIVTLQNGIWPTDEALRICRDADAGKPWAFSVESAATSGAGSGGEVFGIRVDAIMAQAGRDTVDLLKLDIEGAERAVLLEDDAEWLSSVRVLVVEIEHPSKRDEFIEKLWCSGLTLVEEPGECSIFVRHDVLAHVRNEYFRTTLLD